MTAISLILGYNFFAWLIISGVRFMSEEVIPWVFGKRHKNKSTVEASPHHILPTQVAVIMAAHNEELALPNTLTALKKISPLITFT